MRLTAVDAQAAALGLSVGQLLADARALAPALACLDHDAAADAAGLARLARWCARFSPLAAPTQGLSGSDGLFLEVEGVAHLFGGEGGWLAALLGALRRFGFEARGALADTPGAAWALSRYDLAALDPGGVIAPPGAGLAALFALPAAALRLPAATAEGLRAVGLKRVGDVVRAPRAGLARRFGQAVPDALDRVDGRLGEPIDALHPAPRFCIDMRFAAPLLTAPGIEAASARLAQRLCAALDGAGRGGRRFLWRLRRVDGEAVEIALGAARPLKEALTLTRLLQQRFETLAEGLDLGFGIEAMSLAALETQLLTPVAMQLAPDPAVAASAAAADLGDRLAARLGEAAVTRLAPAASHLPERAQVRAARDHTAAAFAAQAKRPLFLFSTPEPIEAVAEVPDGPPRRFRWRRVTHKVARADGPERIAAEWWREPTPTRDYYRVETEEGRRFWLCREGLYEREPGAPRWFVHGSFG